MMTRRFWPVAIVLLLLMQSCFKEDDRIEPHPRGNLLTDTIPLTENYLNQVFYSLDSNGIVSINDKTLADLGFECSPDGWRILLNTADFMKVSDLGPVPFGLPYDTTGRKLIFDKSNGDKDSTAIGQWFRVEGADTLSNGHVYAVSCGIDELGNPLGAYQVVFDSLKNGVYHFRFTGLSGGTVRVASVPKSQGVNFSWYSLRTAQPVGPEPPADRYDLVFTQYTTLLFTDEGIPYPYLVTGVLMNRKGVSAARDSISDFFRLDQNTAMGFSYSNNLDHIGYDWKEYDFDAQLYTVRPGLNFVVRSVGGYYYKLRFIGFYDINGRKGYPVIEYQRL